jgi:hypothetical protein
MISGRTNCSDDWLPARIRPVRGESFGSLCRRLAAANGITPAVLLRGCMSMHPGVQTPMEAGPQTPSRRDDDHLVALMARNDR